MEKEKDFTDNRRKQINKAAETYLTDQEDGDNCDAYAILLEESEKGNGDHRAADFVAVWSALENTVSVDEMIHLIEDGISEPELPELYKGINWNDLKGQKSVLLTLIGVIEDTKPQPVKFEGSEMVAILVPKEMNDALYGILHQIDSIQDDAVDNFGLDENTVFDLHPDEDDDKEVVIPEVKSPVEVKPTEKFKVWVEVERIGLDADGNEETYTDEECPVGIAYRDNIEDAVNLQNLIQNSFGEI